MTLTRDQVRALIPPIAARNPKPHVVAAREAMGELLFQYAQDADANRPCFQGKGLTRWAARHGLTLDQVQKYRENLANWGLIIHERNGKKLEWRVTVVATGKTTPWPSGAPAATAPEPAPEVREHRRHQDAPKRQPLPQTIGAGAQCAFIIGPVSLPRDESGNYMPHQTCGLPVKSGYSYCPEHHRLCYRTVDLSKGDAALWKD